MCQTNTLSGADRPNGPARSSLFCWVPTQHYDAVAGWVNSRRLTFHGRGGKLTGAKLVYERVPRQQVRLQSSGADGMQLADCIDVKDSLFSEYLRNELTKRADFRCTATLGSFAANGGP